MKIRISVALSILEDYCTILYRDDPYHTVSFHGFDPFAKERLAIPL